MIFSKISNNYVWNIKKKWNQLKTGICWHCLFWFDLPYRKEEGKFKQGTKNVCQGLSKVFVFWLDSRKLTHFIENISHYKISVWPSSYYMLQSTLMLENWHILLQTWACIKISDWPNSYYMLQSTLMLENWHFLLQT